MKKRRTRLVIIVILFAVLFAANLFWNSPRGRTQVLPDNTFVGLGHVSGPRPSDAAAVEALVREAIDAAGGLNDVIDDGDTVLLKPNLVIANGPFYTDPLVCRAVTIICCEAGAGEVIIAEGTAGCEPSYCCGSSQNNYGDYTLQAFANMGYDTMANDCNARLEDLNISGGPDQHDTDYVTNVQIPDGYRYSSIWLSNHIVDADVVITVPLLASKSGGSVVTCGLKNWIGITPVEIYHDPGSWICGHGDMDHANLQETITDLQLACPADFAVVDGLRGYSQRSELGSSMNCIVAGRDIVAVDSVCAMILGYETGFTQLGNAQAKGLGTWEPARITVSGDAVSAVRQDVTIVQDAVRSDSTAPSTATITSPTDGETVMTASATVTVEGTDNDGVNRVELWVTDSVASAPVFGGFATEAPYSITWDTAGFAEGQVALTVKVLDAEKNERTDSINVTLFDETPPSVPVDVTVVVVGNTIVISWTPSPESDTVGYLLYRGTEPGVYGEPIDIGNVTSYTDTTALPGTTYYYAIASVDTKGNQSALSVDADPTHGGDAGGESDCPRIVNNMFSTSSPLEVMPCYPDGGGNTLVTVKVYDLGGTEIARLAEGSYDELQLPLVWHGDTSLGEPASSGMYYLSVKSGAAAAVKKIYLVN